MARRNVGERWCDLRRWVNMQLLGVMCVSSSFLSLSEWLCGYAAVSAACVCVCAPVCADEGKRKKLHVCISLAVFSFTESKSWKYHIGHCYRVGLLLSLLLV